MIKHFLMIGTVFMAGLLLFAGAAAEAEIGSGSAGSLWYGPGHQPMSPGAIGPNPYVPSLPSVGQYSPSQPSQPQMQRSDAQTMLNKFITINPNLKAGPVKDQGQYFRADVLGKDGTKVNEILVDKATGAMHSVYQLIKFVLDAQKPNHI